MRLPHNARTMQFRVHINHNHGCTVCIVMYVPAGLMIYPCVGVGWRPQDCCFATLQALHLNPLASHDKQNMV